MKTSVTVVNMETTAEGPVIATYKCDEGAVESKDCILTGHAIEYDIADEGEVRLELNDKFDSNWMFSQLIIANTSEDPEHLIEVVHIVDGEEEIHTLLPGRFVGRSQGQSRSILIRPRPSF